MKAVNTIFNKMIFTLELAFFLIITFVILYAFTPNNVLNSNSLYKMLQTVGIFGTQVLYFGMPVGVIGIITSKGMIKLRKATVFLSIVNLTAGIISIFMILLIFLAVIFGRISV